MYVIQANSDYWLRVRRNVAAAGGGRHTSSSSPSTPRHFTEQLVHLLLAILPAQSGITYPALRRQSRPRLSPANAHRFPYLRVVCVLARQHQRLPLLRLRISACACVCACSLPSARCPIYLQWRMAGRSSGKKCQFFGLYP